RKQQRRGPPSRKLRNVDNGDKRAKSIAGYSDGMASPTGNQTLFPSAPSPDAASARRVLGISTVGFTLLFAVWLMFGVLGVPIRAEFHLSTIQFAWLGAIAVLSGSIWRLPLGLLAERVGGRVLLVAALALSVVT